MDDEEAIQIIKARYEGKTLEQASALYWALREEFNFETNDALAVVLLRFTDKEAE